ncbi:MAG: response regulator [Chloroflexales bacterium]
MNDITDSGPQVDQHRLRMRRSQILLSSIPDLVFCLSREGVILDYVAPETQSLYAPPSTFIGQHISAVLPPHVCTPTLEALRAAFLTGRLQTFEYPLMMGGEERSYEARVDTQASTDEAVVIVRDITERARAEQLFQQSQANLETAQELAHLGSWDLDLATRTGFWSRELFRILQYDPVARTPSLDTFLAGVYPVDRAIILEASDRALRTGERVTYEYRSNAPLDKARYYEATAQAVAGERGGAGRLAGTVLDITERKRAELERQALLEIMQGAAASSDIHTFLRLVQQALARVIAAENLFVRLLHPGKDEVDNVYTVDKHGRSLVPTLMAHSRAAYVCRVGHAVIFSPESFEELRLRGEVEGGVEPPASWMGTPLAIGERIIGVLAVFDYETRDCYAEQHTTFLNSVAAQVALAIERQQAEEALVTERNSLARRVAERTADLSRANIELGRAVHAKDEFLANMSHELRTPLNAILGMSESLLEQYRGPLNPHQQEMVSHIETSGHHLLALINDILDLSKVEAGRMDLQIETVGIADMCQASLLFVKEQAIKRKLQLAFQLNDQLAQMDVDPKRLKQILVNLLTNAVKFTEPGGRVSLEVDADPEAGVVRFAVQDTGIGITPESLAQLFQPFVQLDSRLNRQHEGTGLGLALVRHLAELHGGSIAVESTPGVGSRFTVALPYASAEAVLTPRPSPTGDTASLRSALVIEDSPVAREQLTRYLSEINIHVTTYPAGAGSLEEIAYLRPDVIFLDLQIPGLSGWEVLARLKTASGLRGIPVIIISVVDEREKGLAAGAAAYLLKPISRDDVRRALALAAAAQDAPLEVAIIAPQAVPTGGTARILLAEDNEINIIAVSDYLRDRGYHLTVARNGREALALAEEVRPDLILMDIQMPEIDGLDATRRLRTMPAFAHTPIIALTALAMPGDRERCLAAGANEYLTKPVRLKSLVEVIQRLVQR